MNSKISSWASCSRIACIIYCIYSSIVCHITKTKYSDSCICCSTSDIYICKIASCTHFKHISTDTIGIGASWSNKRYCSGIECCSTRWWNKCYRTWCSCVCCEAWNITSWSGIVWTIICNYSSIIKIVGKSGQCFSCCSDISCSDKSSEVATGTYLIRISADISRIARHFSKKIYGSCVK